MVKKSIRIILACAMLGCMLTACGNQKMEESSQIEIVDPEADLKVFPTEAKLSEEEMKGVASAYADYMTEALGKEGYSAQIRFEDDGSVHFDGVRLNAENEEETVLDLKVFTSVQETFAYLYNSGQVDLEGNMLVSVSEGLVQDVSSAAEEAQEKAEAELDGSMDDSAVSSESESAMTASNS